MAKHHGSEHDLFGEFLGLGFDHQHAVHRAGDDEVELRTRQFGERRVQHVIAVDVADAGAADRPEKRNPGDRQRRRGADQRHDVGIVFEVVAQHGADDLRLVDEARRKKRPHRPIDQPRHQGFLFGRPAFALEEAARDLAGGKGLFLIIDGQREKILAGLGGPHRHRGAQHRRLAIGGEHRAIGLAGDPAGLEHEAAAAPHQFFTVNLEHSELSFSEDRSTAPSRQRSVLPPRGTPAGGRCRAERLGAISRSGDRTDASAAQPETSDQRLVARRARPFEIV